MDWQRFAKKGVEIFIGPDHSHVDRMSFEPDVRIFARELRLRLDQLETSMRPAVLLRVAGTQKRRFIGFSSCTAE